MIQLVFFARLKETLGVSTEAIALPPGIHTVADLAQWLSARGEAWARALAPQGPVRCAVNQEMVGWQAGIRDGDEVAFFPPVTGG